MCEPPPAKAARPSSYVSSPPSKAGITRRLPAVVNVSGPAAKASQKKVSCGPMQPRPPTEAGLRLRPSIRRCFWRPSSSSS